MGGIWGKLFDAWNYEIFTWVHSTLNFKLQTYRDEVFWYYNYRIHLKEKYSYVSKYEPGSVQNVGDTGVNKTKHLTSRSLKSNEGDKVNCYYNVVINCMSVREDTY